MCVYVGCVCVFYLYKMVCLRNFVRPNVQTHHTFVDDSCYIKKTHSNIGTWCSDLGRSKLTFYSMAINLLTENYSWNSTHIMFSFSLLKRMMVVRMCNLCPPGFNNDLEEISLVRDKITEFMRNP